MGFILLLHYFLKAITFCIPLFVGMGGGVSDDYIVQGAVMRLIVVLAAVYIAVNCIFTLHWMGLLSRKGCLGSKMKSVTAP